MVTHSDIKVPERPECGHVLALLQTGVDLNSLVGRRILNCIFEQFTEHLFQSILIEEVVLIFKYVLLAFELYLNILEPSLFLEETDRLGNCALHGVQLLHDDDFSRVLPY